MISLDFTEISDVVLDTSFSISPVQETVLIYMYVIIIYVIRCGLMGG
jgi:hypothetical protein